MSHPGVFASLYEVLAVVVVLEYGALLSSSDDDVMQRSLDVQTRFSRHRIPQAIVDDGNGPIIGKKKPYGNNQIT
jgi:hypothetical protein